jgi:hypothetical protein
MEALGSGDSGNACKYRAALTLMISFLGAKSNDDALYEKSN